MATNTSSDGDIIRDNQAEDRRHPQKKDRIDHDREIRDGTARDIDPPAAKPHRKGGHKSLAEMGANDPRSKA